LHSTVSNCRLERLRLHRFRNYSGLEAEFHPSLNILAGRNAQGKTNLMESIACMAMTRSPRAATLAEVMQWGALETGVFGTVQRPSGPMQMEMRLHRDSEEGRVGRSLRIDGKPRPARQVLGLCPVVLFSPDDLQLVKAGPEGRRRRLDTIISQLDPRAATELLRYRRALDQRNALLRNGNINGLDLPALESFTAELVTYGARVRSVRVDLVARLSRLFESAMHDFSGGTETAALRYSGSAGGDAERCAQEMREQLQELRELEMARGMSLAGPHRDDVEVVINDHAARSTASQGQQRSLVLAWALAEVGHIEDVAGISPLVLLDDVLSELDAGRRSELLKRLAGAHNAQVFVTTTDVQTGERFSGDSAYFAVENGTVAPLEAVR
jgi:DNA replication and repair protein RecF